MQNLKLHNQINEKGLALPLLRGYNDDSGEIALLAMPILLKDALNSIEIFLENDDSISKICGTFYLSLDLKNLNESFDNDIFYSSSRISVFDEKDRIFGTVLGTGLAPKLKLNLFWESLDLQMQSLEAWLGNLKMKHEFAFYCIEEKMQRTFECVMPFKDLFEYIQCVPEELVKEKKFDLSSKAYVEIFKRKREKRNVIEAPVYLRNEGKLVNPWNNNSLEAEAIPLNLVAQKPLGILSASISSAFIPHLGLLSFPIIKSLPIVKSIGDKLYRDRKNSKVQWYKNYLKLEIPQDGMSMAESPFGLKFNKIGTDLSGQPVLEGEINFELSLRTPSEYSDANLKKAVPIENSTATLCMPYFSPNGEALWMELKPEQVVVDHEKVSIRYILNNDWVKISYASISGLSDDHRRPYLKFRYSFQAYKEIKKLEVISTGKLDRIPVLTRKPRSAAVEETTFLTASKSILKPNGSAHKLGAHNLSLANNKISLNSKITKIESPIFKIESTVEEKKYEEKSVVVEQDFEINFPCESYGEFFQFDDGQSTTSVGCQEPFKLGRAKPNLFTEVVDLASHYYKVYRSNQSPNLFLILPVRYVLTRIINDEGSSVPDIFLYSTFDVEQMDNSHCVLNFTLQADIPEYELYLLKQSLKARTAYEPIIEFISEQQAEHNFNWIISNGIVEEIETINMGSYIKGSLSGNIEHTLTIMSMVESYGLHASYSCELTDGNVLQSSIALNLQNVQGPLESSSVSVSTSSGKLQIHNHLLTSIDVVGIHESDSLEQNYFHPIAEQMIAGQSLKTNIDFNSHSNYEVQYGLVNSVESMTEIYTYMEDIQCQLIFVRTLSSPYADLGRMELSCKLKNSDAELSAEVNGGEPLILELPMPLTSYLNDRVISFKLNFLDQTDAFIPNEWVDWNLSSNGNIIEINNQLINQLKP